MQIDGDSTLVGAGSRRSCQRDTAQMMNVLVIDHVLLRESPECVDELGLSTGFIDCGNESFAGLALEIGQR